MTLAVASPVPAALLMTVTAGDAEAQTFEESNVRVQKGMREDSGDDVLLIIEIDIF